MARAGSPDRVDAAMRSTPREWFLPVAQRSHAAADQPLPIGWGQTSSQPSTVRRMLQLLDVQPGHRVLDVGAGSAWTTALLTQLVVPGGSVTGVELEPALVAWGRANLAAAGVRQPEIHLALPGRLGWPAGAPYDRVLVSAQAQETPSELTDQLGAPGVMVLPAGGHLLRVRKRADASVTVEQLGHYRFVPLRGG